jgi:hypothetical protein
MDNAEAVLEENCVKFRPHGPTKNARWTCWSILRLALVSRIIPACLKSLLNAMIMFNCTKSRPLQS